MQNEIARLFPNASPSTRRRNPEIYGNNPVAGRLCAEKSEPDDGGKGEDRGVEAGAAGVGYRITLVTYRHRLLDSHDNLRGAFKAAIDAITESIGFKQDNDARLEWEYGQIQTKGRQGVTVKIDRTS